MGRGKNGTGKILLVTAQLSVYAWRQSSEATCSSQINTARAVAKEFGIQATGKSGVLSWASISLKNSERGTQKVVSEQGTKLDVEISSMIAKGTEVPWIPPTTWFKYLLDHGLWYRLAGLDFEKQHLAPEVWGKFWKQFEALQPDFSLFTMGFSEQELERTCAIFTHGDEGRTLKKNGIMITAVQSVLGYGFDEARLKKRGTKRAANGDELPHLEVNFAGHTFTNRFITSVIPKVLYEQDSDVFHAAMEELTLDLKRLLEDGIRDRHGNVFRVCCIGVKGDWPYLQKVGRLNRAFNTSVKRGAEAKKPRGVCHLCLAGRENFPSEEITTFRPRWLSTVGVLEPWDKRPVHIRFLPHDISNPGSFFMPDLWLFHARFVAWISFGRWQGLCELSHSSVLAPSPSCYTSGEVGMAHGTLLQILQSKSQAGHCETNFCLLGIVQRLHRSSRLLVQGGSDNQLVAVASPFDLLLASRF